ATASPGAWGLSLDPFNWKASKDADVFVEVIVDRAGGLVTGVSYGGKPVPQTALVYPNNDQSKGKLYRFRLPKGGTGIELPVVISTTGSAWYMATAYSVKDVHKVGPLQVVYGNSKAPSQLPTSPPGYVVIQSFAASNAAGPVYQQVKSGGGSLRFTGHLPSIDLMISSDNVGGTTFAATAGSANNWVGLAQAIS
ncbi:MAG: hypothetical protein JOZ00_22720, partial [Mycobacterium sp.]|uniref:hypothetical protein n=1 Tax=Mycobacterium sp. TaxID=1785 RepID=UPI001EBED180